MSQRTAKFVFAIFAGLLAGAPFVTAHAAPAEADKCLSGPKGTAPAGGHWYYRVDRTTKRNCWYVGDAKQKLARAAPEPSPPSTDSAAPPTSAGTPSSIANARAELTLPQARVAQEPRVLTEPRPLATVAGAITPDNVPRANADDVLAQRSLVASRWMLADAGSAAAPAPFTDNAAAGVPENSRPTPTPSKAAPVAALPLAAADTSAAEKPVGSVQMLLIVILGALALAGLLASAIFRFSGARRRGIRPGQRVNWDSVRTDRPSLSDEARARAADDPNQRIAQLLGRNAAT